MKIPVQCTQCGAMFQRDPSKIRSARPFCSQACYIDDKRARGVARFWSRVEKTSTCWLWTGPVNYQGYGDIRLRLHGQLVNSAHRVSWVLHHGALLLPDLCVLHRCDVPPCVNPAHLYVGTIKDNTQDAITRGRFHWNHFQPGNTVRIRRHGEERPNAKLTWAQVDEIRSLRTKGYTLRVLAQTFGVNANTVREIVTHQNWKEEHRPA